MPYKALVPPLVLTFALMLTPGSADENPATLSIEAGDGRVLGSFSQAQLRNAFPQHDLATATPWSSNGEILHFKGPYLAEVLQRFNLTGPDVEAKAADDYVATLAASDINTYNPLIAIDTACTNAEPACVDGFKPLDVEHSGPFYIVWPLAQFPAYYQETKNTLWVWFVTHLRPAEK